MQDNNPQIPLTGQAPIPQTTDLPPLPITSPVAPPIAPAPSVAPTVVAPPESQPQPVMTISEPPKKSPIVAMALVLVLISLLVAGAYFVGKMYLNNNVSDLEQETTTEVETSLPVDETTITTDEVVVTQTGTVTGKLCYPSEGLPQGQIVAKNIVTAQEVSQEYVGSEAGGLSTYSISLDAGKYHLKYVAGSVIGYHNACDGSDATVCSNDEVQVNAEVNVLPGQTIQSIDLCDFYYSEAQKATLESTF